MALSDEESKEIKRRAVRALMEEFRARYAPQASEVKKLLAVPEMREMFERVAEQVIGPATPEVIERIAWHYLDTRSESFGTPLTAAAELALDDIRKEVNWLLEKDGVDGPLGRLIAEKLKAAGLFKMTCSRCKRVESEIENQVDWYESTGLGAAPAHQRLCPDCYGLIDTGPERADWTLFAE
jgi:hypothetical protein